MNCGWRHSLGSLFILYSIFWLISGVEGRRSAVWTAGRKQLALNRTKELWYHGFNNYMRHAFPMDELRPLSCKGRGPDWENP
jgi:mannosidase alpha-like ER degradation enhancer 1